MALLEVKGLHRWFGSLHAVNGVSLEIDKGQIMGFIGPNGAGKTTTIRMLAGLLSPTAGEIHVKGYSVARSPRKTRAVTGFMPDSFGVFENTSVVEYLDFFGEAFGIGNVDRQSLIKDILTLTELDGLRDKPVENLSRGQAQRVSLARCLMHDPEILLLDEPASGLDPRARIELRELLRELARMGKAILISSHILTELQDLCSHLAIIEKGSIVSSGQREEVFSKAATEGAFRLWVTERAEEAVGLLSTLAKVHDLENGTGNQIEGRYSGTLEEASEIVTLLVQAGFRVMGFSQEQEGLEDVFLRMTEKDDEV